MAKTMQTDSEIRLLSIQAAIQLENVKASGVHDLIMSAGLIEAFVKEGGMPVENETQLPVTG